MPNVTLSLPAPVLDNAKRVAGREFRSLSQHVAYLIEQDSNARKNTRRVSAATDSAGRRATPRRSSSRRKEVV